MRSNFTPQSAPSRPSFTHNIQPIVSAPKVKPLASCQLRLSDTTVVKSADMGLLLSCGDFKSRIKRFTISLLPRFSVEFRCFRGRRRQPCQAQAAGYVSKHEFS